MVNITTGARGTFTFLEPYDTLIDNKLEYEVLSVRAIQEIEDDGMQPLETIYKVSNLTEQDMLDDIKGDVDIVVLINDSGKKAYVPIDRIVTFPNISGKRYQGKVITINLGSLPYDADLDVLVQDIKNIAKDRIGVNATTAVLETTGVYIESYEDAGTLETERELNKITNDCTETQLRRCKSEVERLTLKTQKLEECLAKLI